MDEKRMKRRKRKNTWKKNANRGREDQKWRRKNWKKESRKERMELEKGKRVT